MEIFKINFVSIGQFGGIFEIKYEKEDAVVVYEFLDLLGTTFDSVNYTVNIPATQQYNSTFKKNLDNYVDKYKAISPQLQSLRQKFAKLKHDEWFLVWFDEMNTKTQYELEKILEELNNITTSTDEKIVDEIFGTLIENYEIRNLDVDRGSKIKIGRGLKSERICRFCGKGKPEVEFKKEAHAISEALGNKVLIINEECDSCNEFFDKTIERDFIYYHDFSRTIFGIKNKDNEIPEFKGKNFRVVRNEHDLNICLIKDENSEFNELDNSFILKTGKKIKKQNIYKALTKFALSLLERKDISSFDKTIKWLKGEKEVERLPKIAVLNSYHFFTQRAKLTLFIRNNANSDLPFLVGEFKLAYHLYIFIVPFSSKDSCEFLRSEEYEKFLNCFKYVQENQFDFLDFSDNEPRELNHPINFIQNESTNNSNTDSLINITIRQETKNDHQIVFNVIEHAFATEAMSDHQEQFLVERLRKSSAFVPELSLVAEVEEDGETRIVGHILLTKIRIKNDKKSFESLALAPVSVLPEFHGKGIGGKLITHAHEVARELGFKSVVLLGHQDYYPRFGYRPTVEFGIELPFDVPAENCMAVELIEHGLSGVSGMVEYPPEFSG